MLGGICTGTVRCTCTGTTGLTPAAADVLAGAVKTHPKLRELKLIGARVATDCCWHAWCNAETLRLRAKRAPCSCACLQVAGHFNLGAKGVEHIASGVGQCSTLRSLTLERKCHCTRVLQYMNQSTQFNSLIGTTTWHVTECNLPSPALRHLALCTQLEKLLLNSTYMYYVVLRTLHGVHAHSLAACW